MYKRQAQEPASPISRIGCKPLRLQAQALLGKEVRYIGEDMDAFEEQMRTHAPSWSAFDIRMMFQGYLERGFVSQEQCMETVRGMGGFCEHNLFYTCLLYTSRCV